MTLLVVQPSSYPSIHSPEYLLGHDIDSCKRSCIAKDNGFLFTDTKALPDGLSCIHAASESLGLCVAGQCVPIGCDFTLNEHSKRDECGVWCGSGSTCVSIAGNYTSAHSYATSKFKAQYCATVICNILSILLSQAKVTATCLKICNTKNSGALYTREGEF